LSAPLLLAIESATADASDALLRGSAVLVERRVPPGQPASEGLLPALLAALDDAGVALADLDAFAVSIGPGSFTGLRVGVATLKGLAFGAAQRVVAVPTLAALAARAGEAPGPVAALLDARRGEVYAAIFADPAAHASSVAPAVLRPAEVAERLARAAGAGPCRAIGDGVAVAAQALRTQLGDRIELVPPPRGAAAAHAVGRVAQALLARGEAISADAVAPLYLRRAEAEVRRTGERFEL
jgi:tRNA threonylcarbamoyladenosine biosynthesis protein TsaB